MAAVLGISFLIILVSGINCYILMDDDDPTSSIEYPTEYYFKGEDINMISGLVKPFQIWYSAEHNRSRVDLFDGVVKKFYIFGSEEETGSVYMIHSVTSKDLENSIICRSLDIEDEDVDFLPATSGLEFVDSKLYFDKVVQVWQNNEVAEEEGLRAEVTLLVHRTEQNVDIPLEYTMKKYDTKRGAITEHVVTKFYEYKSTVSSEELEVSDDWECEYSGKMRQNFKNDLQFLHPYFDVDLDMAFASYKKHHNKIYEGKEHHLRKAIFHENWRNIEEINGQNLGFKLEVNKFADRTNEELKYLTGTLPSRDNVAETPFPYTLEEVEAMVEELPDELDLRVEGIMRPIKDQTPCGSCWAFSTTAVVEGAVARNLGGRSVDLSEQSLVDCGWGYENMGCDGGMLDTAFKYILDHGIPSDIDYGLYMGQDGVCHLQNLTSNFYIRGFGPVNSNNANAMKVALNKFGPVAVAIHASYMMKYYSSGVFYDLSCENSHVNHGVTVVGYGNENGVPYWIVRNSWGVDWGEDGYILMSAVDNSCHILDTPYYAVV